MESLLDYPLLFSDSSSSAQAMVDLDGRAGDCRMALQLSDKELEQKVKETPLWELSPDRKFISRTFVAKNFAEGLKFFNAVAQLAEEEGHHPDLHLTDYRTVRVVLSTHSLQSLSLLDFTLAARIDKINVEYSPKWLKNNPLPSSCIDGEQVCPDGDHDMFSVEHETEGDEDDAKYTSESTPEGHKGVEALKVGWPQLVPDAELEQRMQKVPFWQLSSNRRFISRTFVAKNFGEGIKFFNAVAQLAEEEGHHPVWRLFPTQSPSDLEFYTFQPEASHVMYIRNIHYFQRLAQKGNV